MRVRRGLDYAGMTKEWDVRTVFAGCAAKPATPLRSISRTGKTILDEKVEQCLADKPGHARELMGMMQRLSYAHVLYLAEVAIVDALYTGFRRRRGGMPSTSARRCVSSNSLGPYNRSRFRTEAAKARPSD